MKPHKLLFLFLALLITALTVQAVTPVVSNIRASQRAGTKLVDIYYDVADASHSSVNVTVAVSSDAGASYSVPAATFRRR
jgi:hypothetical protein